MMELLHEGIAAGLIFSANGSRITIRGPNAARQLAESIMARKDQVLPIILLVEEIKSEIRVMRSGEEPGFARWPQEHKAQWARSFLQIIAEDQLEPMFDRADLDWLQRLREGGRGSEP